MDGRYRLIARRVGVFQLGSVNLQHPPQLTCQYQAGRLCLRRLRSDAYCRGLSLDMAKCSREDEEA